MSTSVTRRHATPSPTPRLLDRAIRDDAAADGVPTAVAWSVFSIPLVGAALLAGLYLVSRDAYHFVLKEDRPVEWGQFALLLLCTLLAAGGTIAAARRRNYLPAAVLAVAALCFLGLAGEEISWAQRVFALVTPESLATVNQQAELNVHNINAGGLRLQDLFKIGSALVGVAGVLLALAPRARRCPRLLRTSFARLLTVPRYAVPGFAMMALYWPVHLVVDIAPVSRFQEWVEFSFYLSVTATLAVVLLRLAPASTHSRAGHRSGVRLVIVASAVVVVAVTIVFAALTAYHGIIPINAQ
ncbi:hypothetical protein FDO65_10760 [Nakamurella flava]|uniref:Uncharacterized protein n=1 Tax=Nakamurella flava TaxID=2576308 RepID=A0A4U6QPH6_9ACTN|nr:hypothetical protein [Nakamurella flava]TKV61976.1 hypothetical protein FDO65_10760 [Nakamurella flava]